MKRFLITLRSKYYFIPSVYTVLFALLAALLIKMDYYSGGFDVPEVLCMHSEPGSNVLIMIIGGLITLVTVAYSVIMIVLTIYGNQLSPRTLQDFLEKKQTIRIIGYYTGVLVYSIISLFAVRLTNGDNLIFAPTAGIVFFIAGIIIFIYFMHLVSKSLQTGIYIQNLVEEASDFIDKKQQIVEENPSISIENIKDHEETLEKDAWELAPKHSGFIQYYDEKRLFDFAKKHGLLIYCNRKAGEHIMEDSVYMKIYGLDDAEKREEFEEEIGKMVKVGEEPNLDGDIFNKTGKLVEIALRALSPGINDPTTAIFCIEKIGFLLKKAIVNSEAKVYREESTDIRVILEGLTFKRMLFDHFYQIKHYGIGDLKVYIAILSALNKMSQNGTYYIKRQIWEFAKYLLEETHPGEYPVFEKMHLYERFYQLAKATGEKEDLKEIFKFE